MDRILSGLVGGVSGTAMTSAAWAMTGPVAQTTDPLSGGAGWAGVGLLGSVLGWLLFVHIPNGQKQIKELLQSWSEERERERAARHEMANKFQEVVSEMMMSRDTLGRELITRQEAHWAKIQMDLMAIDKDRRDTFKEVINTTIQHNEQQLIGLGNLLHKDFDHLNSAIIVLQEVIGHTRQDK